MNINVICQNGLEVNSLIKIIDYKAGNAPSVLHAVTNLGYQANLISKPTELNDATHIILPGVGSAKATMDSLREMDLLEALEDNVLQQKKFFLGICVGLQVLFEHSEEDNADCLGWLKGNVVRFNSSNVRVPQMGWNEVCFVKDTPYKTENDYFYFVNSYYAKPQDKSDIWATTEYDGAFAAAVMKDNIYATQFHIEKSGKAGLSLLNGFLSLTREG